MTGIEFLLEKIGLSRWKLVMYCNMTGYSLIWTSEQTKPFSARQTKTDTNAQCRSRWDGSWRAVSSGDTLFAIILFGFILKHLFFASVYMSKLKDGRVHFINSGIKGLKLHYLPWKYNNMRRGTAFPTRMRFRPVIRVFPGHSVVAKDPRIQASSGGHQKPWSDCADAQPDLRSYAIL